MNIDPNNMTINIPECIPRSSPGTTTEDMKKSLSFTTACPPDVGPKTRLIAVCGITDAKGKASPMEDGWLFSDFYLFHHLFSPLNEPSLSSQVWMTTEEPKDLVQKYGEYVQEDSKGEQRVVLDKNMLPGIEQSGNLCVVSEDDLLKRFLSNLREQSLLAKSESQHLLVLVFGHGDMETLGMTLGGDRPRSNLKIEDIKRSLQPSTPATLFTTSSFPGDWIVQPIVTTIKAKNESWSMPSKLLSRPNASVATSAILQASIAINESQEITREVHDDPDHISYMEAIYESYKGFDHFADDRMIHFSPQDDQWALHF